MRIPFKLDSFIFDYYNSKFIECNRSLAERTVKLFGLKYAQNQVKNEKTIKLLNYTISKLENLKKKWWLAAGSLLGTIN